MEKNNASRPTSTMVDMAVQTDFDNDTPMTSPTSFNSGNRKMADIAEDTTTLDTPVANKPTTNGVHTERKSEDSPYPEDRKQSQDKAEQSDDEEEAVVVSSVQTAATPQFINRARLVSVKKPNAPALPPRNPVRAHGKGLSIGSINSPPPERTSQDSEDSSSEKRPEVERTRSHDSMTLVDLNERKDEVETPAKEKDEFHSVANSPAQSPKLAPVDKVENEKLVVAQTAQA